MTPRSPLNLLGLLNLTGAALLLGLAGCGAPSTPAAPPAPAPAAPSSPAPTNSRLPPRPTELRMDGVDPCALFTPAQQAQLGVHQSGKGDDADEFRSLDCAWANRGDERPDNLWIARAILKRSADYALDNQAPVQVVTVGGFPAVATSSPFGDEKTGCILSIDVAQGQSLWVQYDNSAGDYPGINHQIACQQATKAAELMLRNLRTLTH